MPGIDKAETEPILRAMGLSRSFGGLHALQDVSLDVPRGCIKGVIGPNGAGKTTLFNLISGSLKPDSGTVCFEARPIQGMKPSRIAAQGISRTFQNIKLFHGMTALENVLVGRHRLGRAGFFGGMLNLPAAGRDERMLLDRAREAIAFIGIEDVAQREVSGLSFGHQRAVELARAIASDPVLLLLDEPAAGLNMKETSDMGALVRKIRDRGVTVLMVEHDMSLVMGICDDITVLNQGRKIFEGAPDAVQRSAEVIRVYLGEVNAEDSQP